MSLKKRFSFTYFGEDTLWGTLPTRRWEPCLYSRLTKTRVLNVGNRLTPEYPYPAALEGSFNAYNGY